MKGAVVRFEQQAVAPCHVVLLEMELESSGQALHVHELVLHVVALVLPLETVPCVHHTLDLHRHGR